MPAASVRSDSESMIAEKLRSGSRQALDSLYRKYSPALLGYIVKVVGNREFAEKVLHHAVIDIWNQKDTYEPSTGGVYAWMFRITKQAIVTCLSGKKENSGDKNHNASEFVNIVDISNNKETNIHTLVFKLIYHKNHSLKEVSGLLNLPEEEVRSILRYAIKNLKNPER